MRRAYIQSSEQTSESVQVLSSREVQNRSHSSSLRVFRVIGRSLVRLQLDLGFLLRSEEHTSELQSRQYLVCRLLLEKKTAVRPAVPVERDVLFGPPHPLAPVAAAVADHHPHCIVFGDAHPPPAAVARAAPLIPTLRT